MAASTPEPLTLQTPIVEGGIWSVNFFNGRLLSADTLSDEQAANRKARLQLGAAVGAGVAYGLELTEAVSGGVKQPVVTVEAGLAVNRLGQTLELPQRIDVALTRANGTAGAPAGIDFTDCPADAASAGTYHAGAGLFVFAIGPSESAVGRALVSGLGNDAPTCATAYSVEGVQFRLLRVLVANPLLEDEQLLRNRVAYRFLRGNPPDVAGALARDPFGDAVASYGVDDLWDGCLNPGEVPLGLVYWTAAGGIEFIDRWAVRRRLAASSASARWPLLAGERAEREGEAMLLQFQDHLDDLRTTQAGLAATMAATDVFETLPPVGLVPLRNSFHPAGFDEAAFFAGLKKHGKAPTCVNAGRFTALVRSALAYAPIELAKEPGHDASERELVRLYEVRENRAAGLAAAESYLLFTNGHVPYAAQAQFDLARWGYANFSISAD